MYNLTHTVKRDEVGKRIAFTLRDADGLTDLTPYTITMSLKKGTTVVTVAATVTKETQSGATLGQCYHTWAANTIPDTDGDYQGELKLVNGSNVLYWPVDANRLRTKFTVRVQLPN